ncbi:MAG: TetR/AcrR family transcriptional regulator, partial [Anaerohalosphaeraceae bacterium]
MSSSKKRFSKTTWLEKSLEILSKEGEKKLTVEHLVKEMGVTRGSFYWHFKSRADYIQCLSEYWAEEYSAKAMRLANSEKPDAKERLLFLFQHLTEFDIAR